MRNTRIETDEATLQKLSVGNKVTLELTGKVVEITSEDADTDGEGAMQMKMPERRYFEIKVSGVRVKEAGNEFTNLAEDET